MNQNQREGLLVWLHSRAEKWGVRFSKDLHTRVEGILSNFFAHYSIPEYSRAILSLEKKITKLKKKTQELEDERHKILVHVFELCGYDISDSRSKYSSPANAVTIGQNVMDVIRGRCSAKVDIGDPYKHHGSLIERYANGCIRLQVLTNNNEMIKGYITAHLKPEHQLIKNLNQLRTEMQTQIMLLENISEAKALVKNIKDMFK